MRNTWTDGVACRNRKISKLRPSQDFIVHTLCSLFDPTLSAQIVHVQYRVVDKLILIAAAY